MRHLGGSFKYTLTFFSILYLSLLGTSMMPILRGTYFIWLFGCSKFATCTIPLHCAISLLSLTHVLTQYATKLRTSQSGQDVFKSRVLRMLAVETLTHVANRYLNIPSVLSAIHFMLTVGSEDGGVSANCSSVNGVFTDRSLIVSIICLSVVLAFLKYQIAS